MIDRRRFMAAGTAAAVLAASQAGRASEGGEALLVDTREIIGPLPHLW